MTSHTGSPSRVGGLLLVARAAIAVGIVAAGVVVVRGDGSPRAGQVSATVDDALLDGFIVTAALVGGAVLLLAQIVAGFESAPRRAAVPGPPPASRPRRPRRSAVLGAFGVAAVISVVGTAPRPPGSLAAAAWLVGLGLVGLVLDTVRSAPAPPSAPATVRHVSADAHASATISQVFGSLLLVAFAVTVADQVLGATRPAAAAVQIAVAALATVVPFVLAPVLRAVSRSLDGEAGDTCAGERALRRAITRLRLLVGIAASTAASAFVAVLVAGSADGRLPTYRGLATVLVLLVAVLNGSGLNGLGSHDTPTPRRR